MAERKQGRKVAIVITTVDPETRQVALRCATFHLVQSEAVSIFLVVPGGEAEKSCSSDGVLEGGLRSFVTAGGKVYSCSDRTELKKYLQDGFPMLSEGTIGDLVDDGQVSSMMGRNIHIRVFR